MSHLDAMIDLRVANTIRDQIGNRAFAMMGAWSLSGSKHSLTFKIKGSRITNCVQVTLDPSDTYTIGFFKTSGHSIRLVATVEGVHADNLRSVIESNTGLALSL